MVILVGTTSCPKNPVTTDPKKDSAMTLIALLDEIKKTLKKVQGLENVPPLSKVTLNLKGVKTTKTATSGDILFFGTDNQSEKGSIHQLSMELTLPTRPSLNLRGNLTPIGDALAQAIISAATATEDANLKLKLTKLTASVKFWVSSTTTGKAGFQIEILDLGVQHQVHDSSIQEIVIEFSGPS